MNKTSIYIITILILIGGLLYFLQKDNLRGLSNSNSDTNIETLVSENPTYGHVHSLFRTADGMLLMGAHNGMFHSMDDGKTFNKMMPKGDVRSTDFMTFAYDQNSKTLFAGGHDLGIVKSTDSGNTWIKTDGGIKGTDIHALAINPLDTNRLFAFSVENGVFGTKDGAKSWYRIDDGPDNPGTRAFGYMATPSSMDRSMGTDKSNDIGYLWSGTSGGLYSSFACFCGWTKTKGISDNATIYTLASDLQNPSTMFAGTKDGIYKTTDEGKSFSKVGADIKDVAALTFDLAKSDLMFAATSTGEIHRSDDKGNTWILITKK